jgi:hypothetical protein
MRVYINNVIACRELGEKDRILKLVKECDWLPMGLDIQIAVKNIA